MSLIDQQPHQTLSTLRVGYKLMVLKDLGSGPQQIKAEILAIKQEIREKNIEQNNHHDGNGTVHHVTNQIERVETEIKNKKTKKQEKVTKNKKSDNILETGSNTEIGNKNNALDHKKEKIYLNVQPSGNHQHKNTIRNESENTHSSLTENEKAFLNRTITDDGPYSSHLNVESHDLTTIPIKSHTNVLLFFVHYINYNKRLDEWTTGENFLLDTVEIPKRRRGPVRRKSKNNSPFVGYRQSPASMNKSGWDVNLFKEEARENISGSPENHYRISSDQNATEQDVFKNVISDERDLIKRKSIFSDEKKDQPKRKSISPIDVKRKSVLTADQASIKRKNVLTAKQFDIKRKGVLSEDQHIASPLDLFKTTTTKGDIVRSPMNSIDQDYDEAVGHGLENKVKNINYLYIRNKRIETWYYSPFPSYIKESVYICPGCLFYLDTRSNLYIHLSNCQMAHPPGKEIYRHDNLSFFELDGHLHKNYCRNISLISKCFLDHKTLFYDVDLFMFYVLVRFNISEGARPGTALNTTGPKHPVTEKGEPPSKERSTSQSKDTSNITEGNAQNNAVRGYYDVVGYFSKEKVTSQGYNLACLLVLPHEQRKGYGKLLIDFSYMLSRTEQMVASPEKPLSDLGYLSYLAYWKEAVIEAMEEYTESIDEKETTDRKESIRESKNMKEKMYDGRRKRMDRIKPSDNPIPLGSISLDRISQLTSIQHDDLALTFHHYKMIKFLNGELVFVIRPGGIRRNKIRKQLLRWKGHCFNRSRLRLL